MINNFRECLPKSKRNFGRPGSLTENVIEFGPQFHRLVPDAFKRSKEILRSHDHTIEVKIPQRKGQHGIHFSSTCTYF